MNTIFTGKTSRFQLQNSRVQGTPEILVGLEKGDKVEYASLSLSPKLLAYAPNLTVGDEACFADCEGKSWAHYTLKRCATARSLSAEDTKAAIKDGSAFLGLPGRIEINTRVDDDGDTITSRKFYFADEVATSARAMSDDEAKAVLDGIDF